MRYELIIDSGNAALVDDPDAEIARILERERVWAAQIGFITGERPIMDGNGNTIGFVRIDLGT